MNKSCVVLLTMLSLDVLAESKQLICQDSAQIESERINNLANKYRNENKFEQAEQYNAYSKKCAASTYGSQFTFIFDSNVLSNPNHSNVEVAFEALCGLDVYDVVKGFIETTPNILIFKFRMPWPIGDLAFNIDRKTLKGGPNTVRNYNCILKDVDTSSNIL
ncbi:hypothetical protein [Methylotuvimicrobium sp.]|uniref:hypothetical protein n=1 Tax=Methylotuvimicrobium sp. TaxID=2822413 RepID=UPI003D64AC7A